MSNAYTSDGKRRSSQTHARRGHQCEFCEQVSFGNGGNVAHARTHVRSGEAIELVRETLYAVSASRYFMPAGDPELLASFLDRGYAVVEYKPKEN